MRARSHRNCFNRIEITEFQFRMCCSIWIFRLYTYIFGKISKCSLHAHIVVSDAKMYTRRRARSFARKMICAQMSVKIKCRQNIIELYFFLRVIRDFPLSLKFSWKSDQISSRYTLLYKCIKENWAELKNIIFQFIFQLYVYCIPTTFLHFNGHFSVRGV